MSLLFLSSPSIVIIPTERFNALDQICPIGYCFFWLSPQNFQEQQTHLKQVETNLRLFTRAISPLQHGNDHFVRTRATGSGRGHGELVLGVVPVVC